ncbi:MAG TPA: molybdate ABC transporter substrate-binding protein [Candidatus Angelobacter sp.]|nr:molybdate ABC transporter substrate-binding protein [Candidatus Angelobacter sp.]
MLSFHLQKNLRDFTLDIKLEMENKTLALIGHSGCGKSTTLQLLAGLQMPDQAHIQLDGKVLIDTNDKVMVPVEQRHIGYVFQDYALFPHLTVRENVLYGIKHFDRTEQETRLEEVLSLLQLEAFEDVLPASLSGGQQQRVALARALVTRPSLLLLDEPLSALDVTTRGHVRTELKVVLESLSIPSIVVTHDYEDARVLGDRIAVIDQGKLIQIGTPEEIGKRPASPFVAQFVGTNLVVGDETDTNGKRRLLAFDPWKVKVTREPMKSDYQWAGTITDMANFGAFNRLFIHGNEHLVADIPSEDTTYHLGESVFVSVERSNLRVYESSPLYDHSYKPQDGNVSHSKASIIKERRKRRLKMAFTLSSMAAVMILLLFFSGAKGFGGVSEAKNSITMEALIAANATDPFNQIIVDYKKSHPSTDVKASYAGTQVVQTQLENGSPADIFLSANLSHIQQIQKEGLVKHYFKVSNNHEVIIVPKNNPAHISSIEDLATKKPKLIIGVDNVPIGQYTRQIFKKVASDKGNDFENKVMGNVVSTETNVKQILEKIALGEGDAGIVYVTDVTKSYQDKLTIIPIPQTYNLTSTNYIAVPIHAPHKKQAEAFLKYILSSNGQDVFRQFHYDPLN